MSDSEPNETRAAGTTRAFRDLELLVRHLADELAGFRRRAFAAEAQLRTIEAEAAVPAASIVTLAAEAGVPDVEAAAPILLADGEDRVAALERENADLRRRLEQAGTRTRQLLERVRFLRQQHVVGG